MAVAGLNGSGKSTLLKAVAGLIRLDGGNVTLNGEDITEFAPEDRRTGYVPQQAALFERLTVRDNIAYARRNGRGLAESTDRAAALLGLTPYLDKLPRTLSGGYRSRVSLARAIASDPYVLLLDEPLSALDVMIKERVLARFASALASLSIPVLYVTHDAQEAAAVGDVFCFMASGSMRPSPSAKAAFASIRETVTEPESGSAQA